MQQIRHRAYFLAELLSEFFALLQLLGQGRRLLRGMLRGQRETHRQSGEDLTCAVVELAGNVPPFFVLSLQQTTGEIAELLGLLHDLGRANANLGTESG